MCPGLVCQSGMAEEELPTPGLKGGPDMLHGHTRRSREQIAGRFPYRSGNHAPKVWLSQGPGCLGGWNAGSPSLSLNKAGARGLWIFEGVLA